MTVPLGDRRKDVELTPRQRDVLRLMGRGKTNPEIAAELGIGFESVKSHVSEVLGKLGVGRREEAAAWWREERSLRRRAARFRAGVLALLPRGVAAVATGAVLVVAGALIASAILIQRGDSTGRPEASATTSAGPTASSGSASTVVLPRFSPDKEVLLPGVVGTLVVDGRCLYVDNPTTRRLEGGAEGERLILAFPADVGEWDTAGALIVDGERYVPGTRVGTGLGGLEIGGLAGFPQPDDFWLVPPDPSCKADGVTFISKRT